MKKYLIQKYKDKTKICKKCSEIKSILNENSAYNTNFSENPNYVDGFCEYCRGCEHNLKLKAKYLRYFDEFLENNHISKVKTCEKCKKTLNLDKFFKFSKVNLFRKNDEFLQSYFTAVLCFECASWERNKLARYWNNLRKGSFRRKREFNLPLEDFKKWYVLQDKKCVYCDLEEGQIQYSEDRMTKNVRRLTIDRINSQKGYTIDNMVLACMRCNSIKSNYFSYDQMKEIAEKYVKNKPQKIGFPIP